MDYDEAIYEIIKVAAALCREPIELDDADPEHERANSRFCRYAKRLKKAVDKIREANK